MEYYHIFSRKPVAVGDLIRTHGVRISVKELRPSEEKGYPFVAEDCGESSAGDLQEFRALFDSRDIIVN